MRGLGLGVALVAGGLLLSVWTPLPFLLAAAAAVLATVVLVREVRGKTLAPVSPTPDIPRLPGPGVFRLVRERPDVRAFVAANALWELSFMGLKTFIVLFVVKGLGESVGTASAVMGVVAGAYVSRPSGPAGWLTQSESTGSCASPSGSTASYAGRRRAFVVRLVPDRPAANRPRRRGRHDSAVRDPRRDDAAGAEGALTGLFSFSRARCGARPDRRRRLHRRLAPVFPATNGYAPCGSPSAPPFFSRCRSSTPSRPRSRRSRPRAGRRSARRPRAGRLGRCSSPTGPLADGGACDTAPDRRARPYAYLGSVRAAVDRGARLGRRRPREQTGRQPNIHDSG